MKRIEKEYKKEDLLFALHLLDCDRKCDKCKYYSPYDIQKCQDPSPCAVYVLKRFIEDCFDNLLDFEEIEDGDWVWNNVNKEYVKVHKKYVADNHNDCYVEETKVIQFIYQDGFVFSQKYKENEIYKWQVIDDE